MIPHPVSLTKSSGRANPIDAGARPIVIQPPQPSGHGSMAIQWPIAIAANRGNDNAHQQREPPSSSTSTAGQAGCRSLGRPAPVNGPITKKKRPTANPKSCHCGACLTHLGYRSHA